MVTIEKVKEFWNGNPCGNWLSEESTDRTRYFTEIATKRYATEYHIPLVAQFEKYQGKHVLEIGCGMGVDGLQFQKAGAHYTGIDLTPAAIELAKEQASLLGNPSAQFHLVNAEEGLPFPDNHFDHVYSFGVIHHSPNTEKIVAEIHRVLKPHGTFCVMVYNRSSINYYIEIMFLRKLFRYALYLPFMPTLLARLTGFDRKKLETHQRLLHGEKKLTKTEWISMNTDGPNCPLAKVYSKKEAQILFNSFDEVHTQAYFFDRSHWPVLGKIFPNSFYHWLGSRWGWHRVILGKKKLSV